VTRQKPPIHRPLALDLPSEQMAMPRHTLGRRFDEHNDEYN
jgi:hypothetical protein